MMNYKIIWLVVGLFLITAGFFIFINEAPCGAANDCVSVGGELRLSSYSGSTPFTVTVTGPTQVLENVEDYSRYPWDSWNQCGFGIDWGDGTQNDGRDPVEHDCADYITHTYTKPGTYRVTGTMWHLNADDSQTKDWAGTAHITVEDSTTVQNPITPIMPSDTKPCGPDDSCPSPAVAGSYATRAECSQHANTSQKCVEFTVGETTRWKVLENPNLPPPCGPTENCEFVTATSTAISLPLRIEWGKSFGLCGGYCYTKMVMTKSTTTIEQHANGVENKEWPAVHKEYSTNKASWDALVRLVDMEKMQKLPDRIGCPDCDDSGAEWVAVTTKQDSKQVAYKYGDPPVELKDLAKRMEALYNSRVAEE